MGLQIELFEGPRDALAFLFSEADDSESQIAEYRELGDVLVALSNGNVIGHAQVVDTDDPGKFELKSLAVDPNCRSQGIGAALVQAAIAHCRERGGRTLILATAAASIPALKFYQRQGFRMREIIRDFYASDRGYRPVELDGIPLRDEVIFDIEL